MNQRTLINEYTEKLINEIAGDLIIYLLNGNLLSFIKDFDPLLNIIDFNKLLRIHFILTQKTSEDSIGVIDFIQELTEDLNRIKTISVPKTHTFKGEVKGKINWKKTNDLRSRIPSQGNLLFNCDKKEKSYDIKENLVLKKILHIIHKIVFEDLDIIRKENIKRNWFNNWLKENNSYTRLIDEFNQIYHKNIYLKRISLEKVKISSRDIRQVLKSRSKLYRDAARLLIIYNNLMNYDIDISVAKEILNTTFILPERESVLFEFYWILKIIRLFRIKKFNDIKYEIRSQQRNLVASWSDNAYTFKIYHDSIGNFKFFETIQDLKKDLDGIDNFFSRSVLIREKLPDFIAKGGCAYWIGRPDIILEKYNDKGVCEGLLIGEVKYTKNQDYALIGLKELLEYISLVKEEKEDKKFQYKEELSDLFFNLKYITGILFTKEIEKFEIKPNSKIYLIQYGDNLKLKKIIDDFVV